MLRAVRDISDCLHTEPDEVLEIASSFYESLFMADAITHKVVIVRDEVWSFVRRVVFEDLCLFQGFLHIQPSNRESANHLECEETDDIDRVVRILEVQSWREVEEFAKAFC